MSSSTGSGLPSGETNVLVTCDTSMMVAGSEPDRPTVRCDVVVTGSNPVPHGTDRGQRHGDHKVNRLSARR